MKKIMLWVLAVLLVLPVLVVLAGAIAIHAIDQKMLLNQLSDQVKTMYGRNLQLNGDVQLKWFPSIGIQFSDVVVSEYQNQAEFLQAKQLEVSLALLPLLSSALVVDEVTVDGLVMTVIKDKAGQFNFSKGLPSVFAGSDSQVADNQDKTTSSAAFSFSVKGVDVSNLTVNYIDQTSDLNARIENLTLTTGKLAENTQTELQVSGQIQSNQPEADLKFDLSSQIQFALGQSLLMHLVDFNLNVVGAVTQQPLQLDLSIPLFKLEQGSVQSTGPIHMAMKLGEPSSAQSIQTEFTLNRLSGSLQQILTGDLQVSTQVKQVVNRIELSLQTPLVLNLNEQQFEWAKLKGDLNMVAGQLPQPVSLPIAGSIQLDGLAQSAKLLLRSALQSNPLTLDLAVKNFSSPLVIAKIDAGAIDLDQLLSASSRSAATESTQDSAEAVEKPIDLSALKRVNAQMTATVDSLKVSNVELQNIKLSAILDKGLLTVSPLAANLYEGQTTGLLRVNANTNAFEVLQNFSKVQIQPVLLALTNKDMLLGRGDLFLDLTTQGTTSDALKQNLNGRVSVALNDGAVKGFNLAKKLREAKNLFNPQAQTETVGVDTTEKTDFSSMSMSFNLRQGVATSDDLKLMAPLFRIGGQGQAHLVDNQLDYTANAAIVATSTGQGGKTFEDGLKGLTVPVRLYGDFANLQWQLLLQDMAKAAIKAKADEQIKAKKEELKAKVEVKKEELKSQFNEKKEVFKAEAENKLKDGLSNFLGR